jgi:hypothetical protein
VDAASDIAERLIARHVARDADRIRRGVRQVAERWWPEDGSAEDLASFCEESWLPDEDARARCFARLEEALEQVDGHLHEIHRELSRPTELDTGPITPVDLLLQRVDLAAHVDHDLFRTRVAFHALLQFPVHTLEERLREGPRWTREEWARSRMMDRFAERIPPPILQGISRALRTADLYIAEYNISMGSLVDTDGSRPFPEGLRLISHWGLRDELRSHYGTGTEGLRKQRLIRTVMERIVRQEIPAEIRNSDGIPWCPETNAISRNGGTPTAPEGREPEGREPEGREPEGREPDTRYAHLLSVFHALRAADPYTPTAPTFIRRRFEQGREIPEDEAERLIRSVLEAPEVDELARSIASRLGRDLEPFDIWYAGYMPRASRPAEELDRVVRERYPTSDDLQRALPRLLEALGFTPDRSAWLAERIVVDAARGAGHALGAARRGDRSHLRTRASGGMTFQSFDTAAHELGHCVEQVFSLDAMDHWSMSGVPNTAFTEAFAFTFQDRGLELLGYPASGEEERRRDALEALWSTFEIGGVSLVDMRVWRWMYANPDATPAALREAVVGIARGVWNEFLAPRFGVRDVELLAIYSHIIESALYTPDYTLGRIIAFQIAPRLRSGDFGAEVERMTRLGRLTPDAWMRAATGGGLSAEPLLEAARDALRHGS